MSSYDDDDDDRSITSEISGVSALTNTLSQMGTQADDASDYGDYQDDDGYGEHYARDDDDIECAHACAYCGIRDPNCVAQCMDTGKWFCNGKGNNSASHIVQHLVLAKKHSVCLHDNSELGECVLECYNCGTKNVFNLGVVFAQEQQAMALICRDPCMNNKSALNDMQWNSDEWQPIIKEKEFNDFFVKKPNTKMQMLCRVQPKTSEIATAETVWRDKPDISFEEAIIGDLGEENEDEWLYNHAVGENFEDAFTYQNKIAPLVLMESDEDKKLKADLKYENIDIKWEKNGKRHRAVFTLPNLVNSGSISGADDGDAPCMIGDEMKVTLGSINLAQNGGYPWESVGRVVHVESSEITLEIAAGGGKDRRRKGSSKRSNGSSRSGSAGSDFLSAGNDLAGNDRHGGNRVPDKITDCYVIELIWKSTSYDRMQTALVALATDEKSVSGVLYHTLMGHTNIPRTEFAIDLPEILQVPLMQGAKDAPAGSANTQGAKGKKSKKGKKGKKDDKDEDKEEPYMAEPNASQDHAIRTALTSPLCLIQGPPGTGKTFTSTSIVYHLSQYSKHSKKQILVCAPSNVAVNHLTEKIAATGLKVVRMSAKTREADTVDMPEELKSLYLHEMVPQLAKIEAENSTRENRSKHDQLHKLIQLRNEVGELKPKDYQLYQKLYEIAERELLKKADVICCTCVGAGDPRLDKANLRFTHVLIDESTQAMEAECIIPIVKGCKQLILIGDQAQLGPVILCKKAAKAGLGRSLFERMMQLGHHPIMLEFQYRMHPDLSDWPSNEFYGGRLLNGIGDNDRVHEAKDTLEWIQDEYGPLQFHTVMGVEEVAGTGTSYLNRKEAEAVEKLVSALFKSEVTPKEIGVITPYEGQRTYTTTWMRANGSNENKHLYDQVEVASVDAFQGREKDFIILSCVRSNDTQGIGFLKDPRRLNVALTRARYGVFILGNPSVLGKNPLWNSLLQHCQNLGALVEGPLKELRVSNVTLPIIRQKNDVPSIGYGGISGVAQVRRDNDDYHNRSMDNAYGGVSSDVMSGQPYERNWGDATRYESYGSTTYAAKSGNNASITTDYKRASIEHTSNTISISRADGRFDKRYSDVEKFNSSYQSLVIEQTRAGMAASSNSENTFDDDTLSLSTMHTENTLGAISQAASQAPSMYGATKY